MGQAGSFPTPFRKGCFWEKRRRDGRIKRNTKPSGSRPFQNLGVLSLPPRCPAEQLAHRRCPISVCFVREGLPCGNVRKLTLSSRPLHVTPAPKQPGEAGQSLVSTAVRAGTVFLTYFCCGFRLSKPQF